MIKFLRLNKWNILLLLLISIGYSSCDKTEDNDPVITERFLEGVYPNTDITDGPFIYDYGNQLTVKWIEKNKSVIEKSIVGNDFETFEADFGFPFEYVKSFQNEKENVDYVQTFSNVKNVVALSDIHGQYDVFVRLLRNNNVIDEDNNWTFGSGHLVINGDVFDRGNRVTEILWLIFKLENQAKSLGGRVHFLLGNHELMVLNNDLRYIDAKYLTTSRKMGTTYDKLYSKDLIIGQWLRTKPIIVSINEIIFVHAGISPEVVARQLSQQTINTLFQNDIIDGDKNTIENDPLLNFLKGSKGPVWYRAYFEDQNFSNNDLDAILNYFDKNHIIVGHTTQTRLVSLFGGKVIGIDSGIKNGEYGEVLIYEEGSFYRGFQDSGRISLSF